MISDKACTPPLSSLVDLRSIGFAAFLLLFGLLDYPGIDPAYVTPDTHALLLKLFPSGYLGSMLLATVLAFIFPRIPGRALIAISGTSLTLGLVTFVAQLVLGGISIGIISIPLFFNGVGIVFGFAAWLQLFKNDDVTTYIGVMVIAHLLGALVQMLLFTPLPPLVYGALVLALIAISTAILAYHEARATATTAVAPTPTPSDQPPPPGIKNRILAATRELWQPLLCVVATCFALAISCTITLNSTDLSTWSYTIPAVGKLLGIGVFTLLWFGIGFARPSGKSYLVLYAASIALAALLPIFGREYYTIFDILNGALFNFAYLATLIACVGLIKAHTAPAAAICGVFLTIMYAVVNAGEHFARHIGYGGWDHLTLVTAAFLIVLLASLASTIASLATQNKERTAEKNGSTPPVHATLSISHDDLRTNNVLTREFHLSARELDVLVLMLGARTVPAIAKALFISENTVRHHTKNIHKKLGVHNREELVELVSLLYTK